MARLPVYTQRTVASGIPQMAEIRPAPTGAALQAVGNSLQDVSDSELRNQQLIKRKEEEDAASWSANALADAKLHLTQSFMDQQQNAEPGAPNFRGNFEKSFDEYQQKLVEGAPNATAANYLTQRMAAFKAAMIPDAMQFEAQARIEKRSGEINGAIDKYRNLVATNPTLFSSSLGDLTATINNSGLPEKVKQQKLQDATHGMAFSALSSQINSDPAGTLKQLTSGAWDNYLDPDNRNALQRSAEVEIRQRQAEAAAAAREARMTAQSEISVLFNDAVTTAQMTGKQDLIPPSKILAVFPGKTGQKMVEQLQTAQAIGVDNVTIKSQPLSEDDAFLKSLEPTGGPGATEQVSRYSNAVKQVEAKRTALMTDGATYVTQNVDAVKKAWADVASDPTDLSKAKNAVALTRQAQLDMGVPPEAVKVMPKSQATMIAKQITDSDPTQIGGTIDSTVAVYGSAGLNDVIAAGAPQETKALAFADRPDQALWRQKLAEAIKVKDADLKTQLEARGIKESEIDQALVGVTTPLINTTPRAAAVPYLNSIKRVAMYNAALGRPISDAVSDAWSAFDQQYQFADTYRVPRQWSLPKVQSGLAGVINNLDKLNIAPANSLDPTIQADEAHRQSETIRSLKNGHFAWITNADETGVIMTYDNGQPVLVKDRQPMADPYVVGNPQGLVTKGNIDLSKRPEVRNQDGSVSTVRSMSFEADGKEVLVPTVSPDGRIMSNAEAMAEYRKTGKHLGIFDNPDDADAYAQALHKQQEQYYTATKPLEIPFDEAVSQKYGQRAPRRGRTVVVPQ